MGLAAWVDVPVLPLRHAVGKVKSSVFCSSNGAGGRFAHWLCFTIRCDEIELAWLKLGAGVAVQIGGEDARQMRLAPFGGHKLGATGGKKNGGGAVTLRVPALAGQSAQKEKATGVSHRVHEGSLILTLPEWCFARSAVGTAGATLVKPPTFKMSAPSHKDAVFGTGAAGG